MHIAILTCCMSSPYPAAWFIARSEGVESAKSALHYVAPVGEKDDYVERGMRNIAPYLQTVGAPAIPA